ncbi:MAG: esterase/lipase family protein [Candidatus Rokuibacteriota bacterium]
MDSPPSFRFHTDERAASVPLWREALAGIDWLALRASPLFYGLGVPRGDGSAVVVVPGFLGTDAYLAEMYWWLRRIGYRAYMSRIGRNAECLDVLVDRLLVTVDRAQASTGGPVHLVGHSLGGILARAAASRRPRQIASVATLGSPFRGIRSHPFVLQATQLVRRRIRRERNARDRSQCYTGRCTCQAVTSLRCELPASVRQIAVYTKTDGIVDWRFCVNEDPATDFEVPGSHVGLAFNPCVYGLIANHLACARPQSRPHEVHA